MSRLQTFPLFRWPVCRWPIPLQSLIALPCFNSHQMSWHDLQSQCRLLSQDSSNMSHHFSHQMRQRPMCPKSSTMQTVQIHVLSRIITFHVFNRRMQTIPLLMCSYSTKTTTINSKIISYSPIFNCLLLWWIPEIIHHRLSHSCWMQWPRFPLQMQYRSLCCLSFPMHRWFCINSLRIWYHQMRRWCLQI